MNLLKYFLKEPAQYMDYATDTVKHYKTMSPYRRRELLKYTLQQARLTVTPFQTRYDMYQTLKLYAPHHFMVTEIESNLSWWTE